MIKLIVAIGPNGLIGKGNKMCWHIPAEFKHFKETTMGTTLLMGGNTYKGLPSTLPGRKIAILDKENIEGADVMLTSLQQATEYIESFRNKDEVLFIAGGKFVYETFYQLADELIISHVETDNTGDVYLNLDLNAYKQETIKQEKEFKVVRYFK